MPQSHILASPAIYAMLALCALSAGFMVKVLLAFVAEGRIGPARTFISVAPAPGRTPRTCEQVFSDVPIAIAVRYSVRLNWSHATADSTRSRSA